MNDPDDVPDTCPLCRRPLSPDGDCPECGDATARRRRSEEDWADIVRERQWEEDSQR